MFRLRIFKKSNSKLFQMKKIVPLSFFSKEHYAAPTRFSSKNHSELTLPVLIKRLPHVYIKYWQILVVKVLS